MGTGGGREGMRWECQMAHISFCVVSEQGQQELADSGEGRERRLGFLGGGESTMETKRKKLKLQTCLEHTCSVCCAQEHTTLYPNAPSHKCLNGTNIAKYYKPPVLSPLKGTRIPGSFTAWGNGA